MLWVCQENMGMGDDAKAIRDACLYYGYGYDGLDVIPFSRELSFSQYADQAIMAYGSTRWIEQVKASAPWKPGTFLNEDATCSVWLQKYGAQCVNFIHTGSDESSCTLGDPLTMDMAQVHSVNGYVFVRPNRDNKAFSGRVMSLGELGDWSSNLIGDAHELENEGVILAQPRALGREWRLFIVDGKVVAGSQYRRYGRLDVCPDYPLEAVAVAERYSGLYAPAPVFVMDICEVQRLPGEYKILEIGCFNSAGFYAADIREIVKTVSQYCEQSE